MFAISINKFESSRVAPVIAFAHSPAKSIAEAVMATNNSMSVAKSLFTRMVYTNGVLNFSLKQCIYPVTVISAAMPGAQYPGVKAAANRMSANARLSDMMLPGISQRK
jgi:hypothetical protein